jgi:hypothetical protein
MRAHEWLPPALTTDADEAGEDPLGPDTDTGTELSTKELSPRAPLMFQPQQAAVPSTITAHVWKVPALTLTAVIELFSPSIPVTSTGIRLSVVDPSPN